ncbi:MAG: two-component sensor histidine kinase [Acidobacteria bacterium]|nr:MAG: two-component sensor histidine kinase [Acidobacteriota bacterium]
MRSLFLKIFVSYWLAQALFLVLAILVIFAFRQRGEFSEWQAQQATASQRAADVFEKDGPAEVHRYLEELRESQHVRAYLFDEQGREVSGRAVPRWADSLSRGIRPPPREFWQHMAPSPFRRLPVTSAAGHSYTLAVMLPPGPFGPRGVPGLGILIGIISSGLVCYLLARYLTSPVVRLRAATRRLAEGDLTARAGSAGSRRRDEIAELVRDFDIMAERLETLVKAQSRLLNDISHELRSPLARLNVALGLARQRSGPETQSALERMELESDRLNHLIGSLLTIARLESGADPSRKSVLALGVMVTEIAIDADYEAQARHCHVKPRVVNDCRVWGEGILLHSAIENVVRNGAHYTAEGTAVDVSLEHTGGEAIIRVADSGPGVPEEALEKMFRPFYRVDDARGRETGGVGLGLAITERTVRLHGGTVKAWNRPEGGLTVEIRLPCAPVPEAEAAPALASAGTHQNT